MMRERYRRVDTMIEFERSHLERDVILRGVRWYVARAFFRGHFSRNPWG